VSAVLTRSGTRAGFFPLRVARVERLCDDAAAVTFDVPDELTEHFRFRPGQSLTLRRVLNGSDERRSYSICATAGQAPRVGVREVPGGLLSSWLVREVRPGEVIEVAPPSGTFTPDLDRPGRHVLIAAGSGITPLLSIAGSLLAISGTDVTMLYGNRRANTVMFADELADLKDRYPPRFTLLHVLSREPREVELFNGRLDADKLRVLLPLACGDDLARVDGWWLCGPHEMVTSAMGVLSELGVPSHRMHRELFYVEPDPPPAKHHDDGTARDNSGPQSVVEVQLDGRTTTLMVPRDVPLLDAAQAARPDLPFACKGGVCGTCRARIVDGQVHMRRNFALEPSEVDAGFVLTCQALCESERVVVDYDA
jgi:ring-1,2-phenylacetyl-CoA epoxidase subunit PaaE